MWNSIKYFLCQFIRVAWSGILLVFLDIADIWTHVKHLLPKKWEGVTLPDGLGYIIGIIIILFASVRIYHGLRVKRMAELLEYSPELKKDKVFRIFYKLYKEGEFLKDAGVERRQQWDEYVLINMQKYCTYAFKMNYLLDTGRRSDEKSPLQDEHYDKAVSIIEGYLDDSTFENYTK